MDSQPPQEKGLPIMSGDFLRAILASPAMSQRTMPPRSESMTKSDRIAAFNKGAVEASQLRNSVLNHPTTSNFTRKAPGKKPSLSSLTPVPISELKVDKVHRGQVVYGKIVTQVLTINSSTVLLEDTNGDITPLAVYGLSTPTKLYEDRHLAILEPFFKLRADGSTGIRVDDPTDLMYDKHQCDAPNLHAGAESVARVSVEERLKELLLSDSKIGIKKLHQRLTQEGYSIKKTQIKSLKIAIQDSVGKDPEEAKLVPIISERRPEKDRVLNSAFALESRMKGNRAFQAKNFEEAEKQYTAALEHKTLIKSDSSSTVGGVHLWQLYGNRCAARMSLGKLEGAMRDSLTSNLCAPFRELKPLLRCAEAMAALGMQSETRDLLESTSSIFPEHSEAAKSKLSSLTPKKILRVGPNRLIKSILFAVNIAPAGAEIVVDPGIYREPIVLTKPVTLRCATSKDGYAAIRSLEASSEDGTWPHIRVQDAMAVVCHGLGVKPIHIIGFRIETTGGDPRSSWHALYAANGVAVVRNCILTSSSGPVCAAEYKGTRLIMQSCAIHGGPQGGVLVLRDAHLYMQQVHCCRHAASGLELREGGSVDAQESHFYSNCRQGILDWHSAGLLSAKECDIHSNTKESGVLVSEAKAEFESCRIYGNGAAGIVVQGKGDLNCTKCEVHDNIEGILIQDTGSAIVEQCQIFSNRANGIFVGFDHRGRARLLANNVHSNRSKGILYGKLRYVVARDNTESNNKNLMPMAPSELPARAITGTFSKAYSKRIQKNRDDIDKAFEQWGANDPLAAAMKASDVSKHWFSDTVKDSYDALRKNCGYCKKAPAEGREHLKCSVCKLARYCSQKCQKLGWPIHKPVCCPKPVEYSSFIDPQMAV